MALKFSSNRSGHQLKKAGVVFAVLAFFVQPLLTLNIPSVFALGNEVDIANVSQLCDAINNQADGQTWNIAAGNYGLNQCNTISAGGQTGWYFPITKNNITINGIGNPTIYGTGYTANGSWASQDFVAIFGNDVTLNGLRLMPKVQPNKAIEVMGSNTTIQNVTIAPNTLTDPAEFDNPMAQGMTKEEAQQWGGSIYYNNASGTQTLNNVTLNNSGVSLHAPNATFNLANVHLNYFASDIDWINDYGFYVAVQPVSLVGAPTTTWHADATNLDNVMAGVNDSALLGAKEVVLDSDVAIASQLAVNQNVTIDGQGHTVSVDGTGYRFLIKADGTILKNINVIKTDKTGVQNIVGVQASNVVVDHVNFTGQYASGDGDVSRAIEISGNNFTISNSTFKNLRQPAYINGFTGTIANSNVDGTKGWVIAQDSDVNFTHNTWGTNATDIAIIQQGIGANHYTCSVMAQIKADNNNPKIDNQVLTNCPPTLTVTTPSENGLVSTKLDGNKLAITGSFTDDVKANYATFQLVYQGNSVAIGTIYGYGSVYNPAATYANADGSYSYNLTVPAGLADGEYSLFYTGTDFNGGVTDRMERKFRIDNTAPTAPSSLTWKTSANKVISNNGATNVYDGTAQWQDTTPGDVDHYVYKYWNDIAGNPYKVGSEYVTTTTGTSLAGVFNQGNGVHHFCIAAVDAAGNTSACTNFTITYDTTAPTITVKPGFVGDLTSKTFSNVSFSLYDAYKADKYVLNGWTSDFSNNNWSDANFANIKSHLVLGTNTLTLYDVAGNSTSYTFTYDTGAPVVTIVSATRDSGGTYTIKGTSDDTAPIKVIVDGLTTLTATPVSGEWTVTTAILGAGSHLVTASSTDAAGNTGTATPAPYSFTVVSSPVVPPADQNNTTPGTPDTTNAAGGAPANGAPAAPQLFATTQPTPDTTANDQAVLGVQDTGKSDTSNSDQAVKGASDKKSIDENAGKFLGLFWYWWLIIVAIIIALWWIIAAARRRKQDEN